MLINIHELSFCRSRVRNFVRAFLEASVSAFAVMAEPSSQRDGDEWQDFNAFKGGTQRNNTLLERVHVSTEEMSLLLDGISDRESALDNEIIKHFDEKLRLCFQNIDSKPDAIYPVTPISEDTTLKCDE